MNTMNTIFFGQKTSCCNSNNEQSTQADFSATAPGDRGCCSISISREDLIRERAYFLWEEAGRPEGDGIDFWVEAEKQIN